jgi:acyl-CoA dehydrogenase
MTVVRAEMLEVVTHISDEFAAPNADDVDRQARFPVETIDGLKAAGVLGAVVPTELGGLGATMSEAGDAIAALSRRCSSSAMILAMHHLQVACLAAHGHSQVLRNFLSDVANRQLLLASATTEVGVGGQLRTSKCALEATGNHFTLEKQAGVISYGAHADAVLATCRRGPDSPPSDQVLVLCTPPGLVLEQTTEWDTLGFRGTCSPGFVLRTEGDLDQVLTDPFGEIAAATMLPVSHVLWAFVWLGIASAALAKARNFVQGEARKNPGTTPAGAQRLAELVVVHQQLESMVRASAERFDHRAPGEDQSMGFALSFNSLKVAASTLVVDVVIRALGISGMAGYSQRSPFAMGRLLRDAHGAALMVNNDRILGDNAQLLLIYKES